MRTSNTETEKTAKNVPELKKERLFVYTLKMKVRVTTGNSRERYESSTPGVAVDRI